MALKMELCWFQVDIIYAVMTIFSRQSLGDHTSLFQEDVHEITILKVAHVMAQSLASHSFSSKEWEKSLALPLPKKPHTIELEKFPTEPTFRNQTKTLLKFWLHPSKKYFPINLKLQCLEEKETHFSFVYEITSLKWAQSMETVIFGNLLLRFWIHSIKKYL